MWNMSCIQCQDVHVPLPQPPPAPPPPSSPPPTPPRFINYSGVVVWAGWSKGTREERSEGTVGVLLLSTAARCLPGSLGLTGGYVPYQDPVYSQPKRLPGTHFHKAAWSPVRKLIPLCRRCTAMLSARLGSAPLCTAPTLHSAPGVSLFCFHLFPPASHLQIFLGVPHLSLVFSE